MQDRYNEEHPRGPKQITDKQRVEGLLGVIGLLLTAIQESANFDDLQVRTAWIQDNHLRDLSE